MTIIQMREESYRTSQTAHLNQEANQNQLCPLTLCHKLVIHQSMKLLFGKGRAKIESWMIKYKGNFEVKEKQLVNDLLFEDQRVDMGFREEQKTNSF